jgi:hypothetical protein
MRKALTIGTTLLVGAIAWWIVQKSETRGPESAVPDRSSGKAPDIDTQAESHTSTGHSSSAQSRKTLQALEIKASRTAASLDDQAEYGYALDICRTRQPLDSAAITESSRIFYRFQAHYCEGVRLPSDSDWSVDTLLSRRASAGDLEAQILLEATAKVQTGEQFDNSHKMQAQLQGILRNTKSATAFMRAGQLLLENEATASDSNDYSHLTLSADQVRNARMMGVMLATCAAFDTCGPGSLLAIRACMPDQCTPGFSVTGYIGRRLSGDEMDEARRYASMLRN